MWTRLCLKAPLPSGERLGEGLNLRATRPSPNPSLIGRGTFETRSRMLLTLFLVPCALSIFDDQVAEGSDTYTSRQARPYNGPYKGEYLERIAFPLGGIGAGMVCLEGNGCLSHVSIRHQPEIFHEPMAFAAVCVTAPTRGRPRAGRPGAGLQGLAAARAASWNEQRQRGGRNHLRSAAISERGVPRAIPLRHADADRRGRARCAWS